MSANSVIGIHDTPMVTYGCKIGVLTGVGTVMTVTLQGCKRLIVIPTCV